MSLRRIWNAIVQTIGLRLPNQASNPGDAETLWTDTNGNPRIGNDAYLVKGDPTGITGASGVTNVVFLTLAEYNAIVDPEINFPTTQFNITDA